MGWGRCRDSAGLGLGRRRLRMCSMTFADISQGPRDRGRGRTYSIEGIKEGISESLRKLSLFEIIDLI